MIIRYLDPWGYVQDYHLQVGRLVAPLGCRYRFLGPFCKSKIEVYKPSDEVLLWLESKFKPKHLKV